MNQPFYFGRDALKTDESIKNLAMSKKKSIFARENGADARAATLQATAALYGSTSSYYTALRTAWTNVGVNESTPHKAPDLFGGFSYYKKHKHHIKQIL
ncbi:hypothetical protein CIG75_01515 [Tumebacillus algifaecis]|uniref:Uncharacterized protein n=1 Tax=Tumebacillus algifaecis TaxID=1214604 RepID=A0A223CWQ9_9BACL|nr:hypothetical protein [Tumebacillus algifaecis]ASS73779.1 hypothetical protein CIG75_01515 [Tumebacillus algifaecis]